VFAYEFSDEDAPEIFLAPVSYPYGAAHGSELQYFFPAKDLTHLIRGPEKLDADQRNLSEMMMRYWTQFAKKGDPNGPLTPDWPRYSPSLDKFQSLAPLSIAPESDPDFASNHHCGFWALLFPQ
jgi:para-nitrobenzyl esterase